MKKILVPIDFSTHSVVALDLACGLAKKSGSSIIALHVVEGVSSKSFELFRKGHASTVAKKMYTHKLLERSRDRFTQLVLSQRYSSVKLYKELRIGNPFNGIRAIIESNKVDLVVMGVKGRSKWEDLIVGSNTEKVVRCSNVPVLTVNKKPSTTNFKRIVYAMDLSENKRLFSPIVGEIQKIYKSKIHFVHINTPDNFKQDTEIIKRMEKFVNKLKLKDYTVNTYNDFSEESGIINFAERVNADMIILSSRGRARFVSLLAGSVTEDVMNRSIRPTLTYVIK